MTPQAMFWTMTTLGALVFFLLGYVGRALRASPAPAGGERSGDDEPSSALQQERDALLAEKQDLTKRWKAELEQQAEAFEKRHNELQARLEQQPPPGHEAAIARLEAQVAEHDSAKVQAEEALRIEHKGLQERTAEVLKLRDAEAQHAAQVQRLQASVAKLESEKAALAKRPTEPPREDGARKELDRVRAELRSSKADADRCKAEADAHRERAERAAAESDKLRAASTKAHEELARLRAEAQRTGADATRFQGDLVKLRAEASKARAEAETQRAEATKARTVCDALRAEAGKARAESDELRRELDAARAAASVAQDEGAQAAAARVDELLLELEQYSARFEAAQAHALRAQRRLDQTLSETASRGEMEAARAQLEESRAQLDRLPELQEEARSLRQKLQAAEARAADAAQAREENRALRDRVADLESDEHAARELERLAAQHKQTRLDNELLRRRLQELQSDQLELAEARDALQGMQARDAERLALRERVRLLEARLFAVGLPDPDREPPSQSSAGTRTIDAGPASLMDRSAARTAVLSDRSGLLVAGAGDPELQESLAAVSGLLFQATEQISSLVPVSRIVSVRLLDDNDIVVVCGMLWVGDETFALSALGPRTLSDDDLTRAVGLASESIRTQMAAP